MLLKRLDISEFSKFFNQFLFLDLKDKIEYFGVFSGIKKYIILNPNEDIFESIKRNILHDYENLNEKFIFSYDISLQHQFNKALKRLARGNRKYNSIFKKDKISKEIGEEIYNILFQKDIIYKEISQEKKPFKQKNLKLKKDLRRYQIQNKIRFFNEFTRFWFSLIYPNAFLINNKKYDEVIINIKSEFERYISFTYERLFCEFIKNYFNANPKYLGSYWDKSVEIDLFMILKNDVKVLGEVKSGGKKICKNILNQLEYKAKIAKIDYDYLVIFSKSGFSKELRKIKRKNLLLFELKDLEVLGKM